MLLESEWTLAPHMHLFTDAPNLGFGAYWDGAWFNSAWSPHQTTFPGKGSFRHCGHMHNLGEWARKRILFHCDNVKPEKVEGPSTTLTFLGIQLDTRAMQASITLDRKHGEVQKLRSHHTCTKQHLLSLIGKLAFACKVVSPRRIFLRRLIDLSTTVGPLHHHIILNHEAHLDLDWWHQVLPELPGTACYWSPSGP